MARTARGAQSPPRGRPKEGSLPLGGTARSAKGVLLNASPALLSFQRMLKAGKDGALLRFALGNELLKAGDPAAAAEHLAQAVSFDAAYTAAWKLYGKALADAGRTSEALAAYRQGISVARAKGDKQAEKEMLVFVRRIEREASKAQPPVDGSS